MQDLSEVAVGERQVLYEGTHPIAGNFSLAEALPDPRCLLGCQRRRAARFKRFEALQQACQRSDLLNALLLLVEADIYRRLEGRRPCLERIDSASSLCHRRRRLGRLLRPRHQGCLELGSLGELCGDFLAQRGCPLLQREGMG